MNTMSWWEVLLVFAGIPTLLFAAVTLLVLRFATARVPDGLAALADPEMTPGAEQAPPVQEGAPSEGANIPPGSSADQATEGAAAVGDADLDEGDPN
jgi:hypothetical protein